MIKPSDKLLEVQQEWDLKREEIKNKYEQDLLTIQRCKDQLDITLQQRTYEYEQDYLKALREYEENSARFDETREFILEGKREAENEEANVD